MADKKEKKYVSDNAQLMSEWDWQKNNESAIYPDEVGFHREAISFHVSGISSAKCGFR